MGSTALLVISTVIGAVLSLKLIWRVQQNDFRDREERDVLVCCALVVVVITMFLAAMVGCVVTPD